MVEGFVYLSDVAPEIVQDIRYASSNNFMGRPAKGYIKPIALCTGIAARALKAANAEIMKHGYRIKVFDAYRPQKAIDDFWNWASDVNDIKMKEEYYPTYHDKTLLFSDGFIGKLSTHSRGSTFDITLIDADGSELDMGSPFDFFGPISYYQTDLISEAAMQNRTLLHEVMINNGFSGYSKEWWHFQLNDEPFPRKPEDHFDFDVNVYN